MNKILILLTKNNTIIRWGMKAMDGLVEVHTVASAIVLLLCCKVKIYKFVKGATLSF